MVIVNKRFKLVASCHCGERVMSLYRIPNANRGWLDFGDRSVEASFDEVEALFERNLRKMEQDGTWDAPLGPIVVK